MTSTDDAAAKEKLLPEFKIRFSLIPHTLAEPFTKDFSGYCEGLVRADPGGITLRPKYARDAQGTYGTILSRGTAMFGFSLSRNPVVICIF